MNVGDRVKVEFEGVVDGEAAQTVMIETDGGLRRGWVNRDACTVIDDPSKDLVGTVRQAPSGGIYALGGRIQRSWSLMYGPPHFGSEPPRLRGRSVPPVGWPIIGAVPGTPAWEAAQEVENDYPKASRHRQPGWSLEEKNKTEHTHFGLVTEGELPENDLEHSPPDNKPDASELLYEVAISGVESETSSYITVQIDRPVWLLIQSWEKSDG